MKAAPVISIVDRKPVDVPKHQVSERGYFVAYRPGETNRCPGCDCRKWHAGRITAECSQCGLPLVIASDGTDEASR